MEEPSQTPRDQEKIPTLSEERESLISKVLKDLPLVCLADTEELTLYRRGVYVLGGEQKLKGYLERTVQDCSTRKVNDILDSVKRRTYVDREEFDKYPTILNLKNCLYDLENDRALEHDPKHYSFVQLPAIYKEGVDCPKIKKFLSEVLYEEDIPLIQEFFGFILWKEYPSAKALMFVGEGSNGKSTLLNLIKALVGIGNTSARGLQELETNRFAKADLYAKLTNLYADLPDVALKSGGTFKMLTGGDQITAEKKFQHSFNFINCAKLLFSTNKIPEVNDDTDSFFRRWFLITFPNTFDGKTANKKLIKELTTEDEISGLLNWALEGLRRLRKNDWNFSNSKSTDEVRLEYIRKSSPIKAFLLDCTLAESEGWAPKQRLFDAFCEYCRQEKLPIVGRDSFFKKLPEFQHVESQRPEINGTRTPCFIGISLRLNQNWKTLAKEGETPETEENWTKLEKALDRPDSPATMDGY